MAKNKTIQVKGVEINIIAQKGIDYISLTDMLKAKDGDFFISDWLRNRNTVEFLGIWESVYNPAFNYGKFAIIKSKAGFQQVWDAIDAYFIALSLTGVEKTNPPTYLRGIDFLVKSKRGRL